MDSPETTESSETKKKAEMNAGGDSMKEIKQSQLELLEREEPMPTVETTDFNETGKKAETNAGRDSMKEIKQRQRELLEKEEPLRPAETMEFNETEKRGVLTPVEDSTRDIKQRQRELLEREGPTGDADPRLLDMNPLPLPLPQPEPLPPVRPRDPSLPGAIHVFGPGPQYGRNARAQREEVSGTNLNNASDLVESGLAVANLVETGDLPLAEEDTPRQEAIRTRRRKARKTAVLLGVIFLMIVTLILVAVLYPGKRKQKSSDDDHGATLAPTNALSIQDYMLKLLPDDTVEQILDQPASSQSQAYNWLVKHPEITEMSDKRIIQLLTLATFYFATNGNDWANNTNWLNYTVNECQWFQKPDFAAREYVSSFFPTAGYLSEYQVPPSSCDDEGLLKHLWLDQNLLVGTIPPEIYLLTSLQSLSLNLNRFSIGMSSHIGRLTNLDSIAYYDTGGNPVPTEFGLLSNLRQVFLYMNLHVGTIPNEFWQLTNLETISMAYNPDLKGTIPSTIAAFSRLRWFAADGVGFTGTLPTEIGQLSRMDWMIVANTQLTGTIPTELGLLTQIYFFDGSDCRFTGTIPSYLGRWNPWLLVDLSNNNLTGSIPTEFGRFTNLTVTLNIHDNPLLSGPIPTELGLLTSLQNLGLQNNNLSGSIPSELGNLVSLGLLSLANNSLTGPIPHDLTRLMVNDSSLHTIALEGNSLLSGTIPEEFCSINATCIPAPMDWAPCATTLGLSFDCSDMFDGCGACLEVNNIPFS